MSQADIQAEVNAIYAQQVDNEMGTARYALLFEPGTYGSQSNPLDIPVGYYTEVDGLGQDPSAVVINGGVTAIGKNGSGALDIFWRSVSNLTIHVVPTADGCHTGNEMWAVSQAAPMRRVDVKDFTTFMPYCENPNFASGGFVADSRLEGGALNGSQQQFYVRNSDLGTGWSNYVWNQVFSGDIAAPAQDFGNGARLHDARADAGEQGEALPVHRRLGRLERLRAVSPDQLGGHHVGQRAHARHLDPAVEVLRRHAVRLGQHDQRRARPGASTCCSRPASTTWTRRSRSSGPTRW